ncbi:MAG TPA: hydroxysqualene dehydroxylase HpnE [Bryobacteraceae bacterium]|nr:hydroxysqualene dehydroxylase HpnE [Bryobacteraceae bacterium]
MPSVIVAGAGLAGLAAAAVLSEAGCEVDIYESRPYPGGRATSYAIPSGTEEMRVVDNCQHILLRCCTNLLDFYRRLGVSGRLTFHDKFYWIEPGGRTSVFRSGNLPAPAHFAESFTTLKFLGVREKVAVARAMLAARADRRSYEELDAMSMQDWLVEHTQPLRAIESFWRQVLVSAVNEELESMSAWHGLQVVRLGFLATRDASQMGVPDVPLGDLYRAEFWRRFPATRFHFRQGVASIGHVCRLASGVEQRADYYVSAVPFDKVEAMVTGYSAPLLEHSPITGVHLWFDRAITDLPHATLLERDIQWVFNKGSGRQLELVISASRSLVGMSRADVLDMCVRQLAEYFPAVLDAQLLHGLVSKEIKATIAAIPGTGARRPGCTTPLSNVFVAGDWTATRWPSTMEGAVRSGYIASESVLRAAGIPTKACVADIDGSSWS